MVLTKKDIQSLRKKWRVEISEETEALLLRWSGEEPYPETYTEQDIYEQSRKIILGIWNPEEEEEIDF